MTFINKMFNLQIISKVAQELINCILEQEEYFR